MSIVRINPARVTKDIPPESRGEVKEWLCRVFGNSPCYGWVLSYRDQGLACADDCVTKPSHRVEFLLGRLTARAQNIEYMIEEWRTFVSGNLNYDCPPYTFLRTGRVSIPMYGFYQEFGFLPRIKDLRQIFGEIFDEDEERLEAVENLKKEAA